MKNRIVYGTLLITGTLLMSNAFAELSQEHWLAQIKQLSPSAVCKIYFSKLKFKKLLDANQIDEGKCITLSRDSLNTCLNQYKDKLPQTFDSASGAKWGKTLGRCMASDFYDKHLSPSYTKEELTEKIKKANVVKRICHTEKPAIKKYLTEKKLTPDQCVTMLNQYRASCFESVMKAQPDVIKASMRKPIILKYTFCLFEHLK